MSPDALISRLDGVRRVGPGRWMAKCSAHDDRQRSLSIREADDGKTLIWCFAGCGAAEVLDAVGLDYSAVFPDPPAGHSGPIRNPVFKSDVFDLVRFKAGVVWLIGCDMHAGKQISEGDYQRLGQALTTLERIKEAAYGSR